MKKRLLFIMTPLLLLTLFFIIPQNFPSLLPVFKITEKPTIISKGTHGVTVTIDLTFGKEDIEGLIKSLETPYPHFFMSNDWIERSDSLIELMKEKNIPIGLLGQDGASYIENPTLFKKEIERFEGSIGRAPQWFRTRDYEFPVELQETAWKYEVNLLGSSKYWIEGETNPKLQQGEILSIPLHQDERIDIKQITQLLKSDSYLTIEQNIFGLKIKTKTLPD